jgi:hypothetical protein
MPVNIPPELSDAAPGIVGSALSLRWIPGTWLTKAAMWAGGCTMSVVGGKQFAQLMHMSGDGGVSLAGFLLGLFSMAVVSKLFDAISAFDSADISRTAMSAVKRKLGQDDGPQGG